MQIATTVGDLTGGEADLLRRAMGSKRGVEKIEKLRTRLYAGMANHGITGEVADQIYTRIEAFASFGFAESHALSFALLVYATSWLKLHYPAAFLVGLLRAQPMGFYSPHSLVGDARHHGVETRTARHHPLRCRRRPRTRRPHHTRSPRTASTVVSTRPNRRCRRSTRTCRTRPSPTAVTTRWRCGSVWSRWPVSAATPPNGSSPNGPEVSVPVHRRRDRPGRSDPPAGRAARHRRRIRTVRA